MRTRSVLLRVLARTALVGALTVTLTPALGVTWASACSCRQASDSAHAAAADAIFTGTLIDTDLPEHSSSSMDPVTYTFAVSRVYKGEVATEQPVRSVISGASCGLELDGTGPFLVFASRDDDRATALTAGLCDGTRPVGSGVDPALGTGELAAVPVVATAPPEGDDARGPLLVLAAALGLIATGGLVLEVRRRHRRPTAQPPA